MSEKKEMKNFNNLTQVDFKKKQVDLKDGALFITRHPVADHLAPAAGIRLARRDPHARPPQEPERRRGAGHGVVLVPRPVAGVDV